jgi:hypothetical protein
VVVIHFIFVVFVVSGGLLLFWSKKIAFLHIPAAFWGTLIEFTGWICPLTPLENGLRYKSGSAVYEGGFIENYIFPVLYPSGLTREIQIILGSALIIINLIIYLLAFKRNLPIARFLK